jgi:transcriptional regulator of acetoin/glycerol metabolism
LISTPIAAQIASVLELSLLYPADGVIRTDNLQTSSPAESRFSPQAAMPTETLQLDAVIAQHVHHVLELNRGNKLRSARQLGISRSTLYRILASPSILSH